MLSSVPDNIPGDSRGSHLRGMTGARIRNRCDTAAFAEQFVCYEFCLIPEKDADQHRGGQGQKQSGFQSVGSFFFYSSGGETGDGRFNTGGGTCMTYGEYRKNKLIDADSFRTQGMCQEYLIEETGKTAQKTCTGQKERTFE